MQVKDLVKYRNKIIKAFKDVIFPSEHFKKSDSAAYNYVLKDVNEFIEDIKSMEEKIKVCLKIFLSFHYQLIMQKSLLILVQIKQKKCSRGKKQNIRFRRQNRTNE